MVAFEQWRDGSRTRRANAAHIEEGIRLALARRAVMQDWIATEPRRALNGSLAWDEWRALPLQVRAEVETPFSARVDVLHYSNCSPAEARDPAWQSHQIRIGERLFDVRFGGDLAHTTAKRGMPLQGILLGDRAAVWDSCLYPLAHEEFAAASALFPRGHSPDQCWATGRPIGHDPVTALLGGKLYSFATLDALMQVENVFAEAVGALSPYAMERALADLAVFDEKRVEAAVANANNEWTETPKQVLCLRLDFTPSVGTPYTETSLQNRMQIASDSLRDMSYGKTWTEATVTPEVLVLPNSYQHYNTVPGYRSDIAADAKAAAEAAGYDLGAFDIHVYAFPRLWRTGTPAWAGGSNQWLNGNQLPSVMVHEFGHNYGLGHANSWRGYTGNGFEGHRNPDFSEVEHSEYGDVFDLMGNDRWWPLPAEPVFPAGHFSMRGKALLNWIEPDEVTEVTSTGTYRVYRFDHADARQVPAVPHALKVTTGEGEELWAGYRRAFTGSPSLSSGAYLIWGQPGRRHRLLDSTPLSQPFLLPQFDMGDGALGVGRTYVDPSGTVRLTNRGTGGVSPHEYLDLRVELMQGGPRVPGFELFADENLTVAGLTGSYVNWTLRAVNVPLDWRWFPWAIAGTRIDVYPGFTVNDWGQREQLGLTWGADDNWDLFSVQWDGYLRVTGGPMQFAMSGDEGSLLWIDLNRDGFFAPSWPEGLNHHWGQADLFGAFGLSTHSPLTVAVPPGVYPVRIQKEEGIFNNRFILFAVPAAE